MIAVLDAQPTGEGVRAADVDGRTARLLFTARMVFRQHVPGERGVLCAGCASVDRLVVFDHCTAQRWSTLVILRVSDIPQVSREAR